MTYQRPFYVGRTDIEVARIIAPGCCDCGSRYPVAKEPAEWVPLEMRSIDKLDQDVKEALIRFRRLEPTGQHYICGDCAYLLTED